MSEEKIDKRTKAYKEKVAMDQTKEVTEQPVVVARIDEMNNLANRIWEGQGSISMKDRVQRIARALQEKGYTTDEIKSLSLPFADSAKYL